MPITITGDIEFLLNKLLNSWVVTLINNKGVTKDPATEEVIDPSQRTSVTITPRNFTIKFVNVWRASGSLLWTNSSVTVDVEAGDIAVIEIVFRDVSTSSSWNLVAIVVGLGLAVISGMCAGVLYWFLRPCFCSCRASLTSSVSRVFPDRWVDLVTAEWVLWWLGGKYTF